MECIFDPVEHLTDSERLGGTGGTINPSLAILCHSNRPFRQVSRIDELNGIAWITGREHFASAVDAHRPVGEAIGLITRSDDEAWSDDQRFPGKPLLGFLFR